jgi:hypothetical protein
LTCSDANTCLSCSLNAVPDPDGSRTCKCPAEFYLKDAITLECEACSVVTPGCKKCQDLTGECSDSEIEFNFEEIEIPSSRDEEGIILYATSSLSYTTSTGQAEFLDLSTGPEMDFSLIFTVQSVELTNEPGSTRILASTLLILQTMTEILKYTSP